MPLEKEMSGMDHEGFDTLTRAMADGDTTRRAALRLVSGGLFAVLATRLGLPGDAAAKQQKRKRRPAPQKEGTLRAEGKRKGKKKGRGKKPPQPKPRECYSDAACGACQRCIDGECRELPALCDPDACQEEFCNPETNSWECRRTCQLESSVCCKGQCFTPCSDGRTIDPETCQCACWPDEWRCADGSCMPTDECCPGERICPGGVCISEDQCCSNERRCGDGSCIPISQCCSDQKRCANGSCVPQHQCCEPDPALDCDSDEEAACCHGDMICRNRREDPLYWGFSRCDQVVGRVYNPATCSCTCPSGSIEFRDASSCCPPGYTRNWGTFCCSDADCSDWVCAIGYSHQGPYGDCHPTA
jgi:hypothetical protein